MTKRVYEGLTPEAMAHVYGHENPLQGAMTIPAEQGTKLIIGLPLRQPTGFHTYPVVEWEVCLDNAMVVLPRTKEYGDGTDYAVKTGLAAIQMPNRNSVIIKGAAVPLNLMEASLEANHKREAANWNGTIAGSSFKYINGNPIASKLTDEQIVGAGYMETSIDEVRICCAWLEAQRRTDDLSCVGSPLRHIIQEWGGRYVTEHAVTIAAKLLGIKGNYPKFNINPNFTFPHHERLQGIDAAFTHKNYMYNLGENIDRYYWEREDKLGDKRTDQQKVADHLKAANYTEVL